MSVKMIMPLLATILLAAGLVTGCQSPKRGDPVHNRGALVIRNNCYSLLYQLLEEQKDVSILRFIKSEQSDLKELVIRIAKTSGAGAEMLENFAKDDRSIPLDDFGLPPGEVATRDAIGATKQKALLGTTGDQFELNLLLTQTDALSYGSHLAQVASANETNPERARALAGLSQDMDGLYQEVFKLLLKKMGSAAMIPAKLPTH